jgi:hypothetical protein
LGKERHGELLLFLIENELPRGKPRGIKAPPRLRRARPGIATPKNNAVSRGVFIIPRQRDKG